VFGSSTDPIGETRAKARALEKAGIEGMMKRMIPEVREVVAEAE